MIDMNRWSMRWSFHLLLDWSKDVKPTRVLIAEDDLASRLTMARLLERNGYAVVIAEDGIQAMAHAASAPDVALIDWMMPGMDGIEVCRRIKQASKGRAYVIMVTARTEKADIVHALETGADDYVTKPVDHDELLARVRAGERIAMRERELAKAADEARSQAERDALTGLFSRRHFDRALDRLVREATAERPLALLMIDLDHFKRINDSCGHQAGDEVLRQVAATVASTTRLRDDIAARYGGEELAVLSPSTCYAAACEMAERIRRRVAELRVPVAGRLLSVTVSIGVAITDDAGPDPAEQARRLIEAADARLYRAKHAGRNQVAA